MKILLFALIACAALALPQATPAATFTVNSTRDDNDISPGDGVCVTAGHDCTLRAAIREANALAGTDTITLPAGRFPLLIQGATEDAGMTGDLDITDDVVINGAGETATIIDGKRIDRVFDVHSAAHVTLSGLTITNGQPGRYEDAGGMLNVGSVMLVNVSFFRNRAGSGFGSAGGLLNSGSATLTHVTFLQNRASDTHCSGSNYNCNDEAGSIGGMWNWGTATLTDVSFRANRAGDGSDGGTGGQVGALLNDGDVVLTDVTFHANRAGDDFEGGSGGAMDNSGTATLTRVTFTHNRAGNASSPGYGFGGDGGGLLNEGTATLNDVTFFGNRAGRGGNDPGGGYGGVGGGINNDGTLNVTNATFDGNRAGSVRFGIAGDGGGIFDAGTTTLTNVTLTRNRAGNGQGYAGGSGGGLNTGGTMTLTNVTLALNRAGKSRNYKGGGNQLAGFPTLINSIIFGPGNSCSDNYGASASASSLGHNLDSGSSCQLSGPGDLSNTDPRLEPLRAGMPLQNHGGFTPTLALRAGSPAIDAGDNTACPATDQRGVARPQGAACDIGAYEFQP